MPLMPLLLMPFSSPHISTFRRTPFRYFRLPYFSFLIIFDIFAMPRFDISSPDIRRRFDDDALRYFHYFH